MNTDRLLRLAAFLETLPAERFDYTRWVGQNWQGKADLSCGTTACALGWAMTLTDMGVPVPHRGIDHMGKVRAIWEYDDGTEQEALEVAELAFDLSWHEARFLFIPALNPEVTHKPHKPGETASPKEVAAHIRKFVEAGGIYVV